MYLHHYLNESIESEKFSESLTIQEMKLQYEEMQKSMYYRYHSNETTYSEQFSESILLHQIRELQYEKGRHKDYEEDTFSKWFFNMNRDKLGIVHFQCMGIQLPLSLDISYLWWIVAFIVPIIGFCLIIPALRKKACASFIVVMMFSSTGLALITGLLTTSWLVGEVEGKMTIGPLNPRCNTRVGMWIGLSTINITLEKSNMYLNEKISINDHDMLKTDQKQAMMDGWPWPMLLVLEYLTGEGKHWAGNLGFYLNRAGRSVYVVLYLSVFLWIVWMVCFTIAAHLACKPLLLSGLLELMCVIVYAIQIYIYIVPYVILEGNILNFSFGWSWWFTLFLGCFHICCGMFLFIYDYFRPGKLTTIFEVDFGLPTHRLNFKKINDNFDNESLIYRTDDEIDSDDFESSTYESFHQPNSLPPTPDQHSPDQANPDKPLPDYSSPDLSEDKQKALVDVCYTPKTYSKKGFSPNKFTPNALTPNMFTTNALTPNALTPNALTPNALTPNALTPNALTPNIFTPNAFNPNDLTTHDYTLNDVTTETEISGKGLLQGHDIPKGFKTKDVKRSILFEQRHSTPHKIYVH